VVRKPVETRALPELEIVERVILGPEEDEYDVLDFVPEPAADDEEDMAEDDDERGVVAEVEGEDEVALDELDVVAGAEDDVALDELDVVAEVEDDGALDVLDVVAAVEDDDEEVGFTTPHSPARDGTASSPLPIGTRCDPQSSDWARWMFRLSQS
jgi:hypothetical protein